MNGHVQFLELLRDSGDLHGAHARCLTGRKGFFCFRSRGIDGSFLLLGHEEGSVRSHDPVFQPERLHFLDKLLVFSMESYLLEQITDPSCCPEARQKIIGIIFSQSLVPERKLPLLFSDLPYECH